jgi:hypothetical protein
MVTVLDQHAVTRRQLLAAGASFLAAFALLRGTAHADVSVWGTIYHKAKNGSTVTQAGDRILLYSKSKGWIGPTFTSDSGYFSFSDLPPGAYSLQIFVGSKSIFSEDIQAPTHVKPILLES